MYKLIETTDRPRPFWTTSGTPQREINIFNSLVANCVIYSGGFLKTSYQIKPLKIKKLNNGKTTQFFSGHKIVI